MATRLILILLIISLPSAASARGGIVAVQSISIPPYEKAIEGFADVCTLPMNRFLLTDTHSVPLTERIRGESPDLILAVGLDALNALDDIRDIPIVYVYVMLPYLSFDPVERDNLTGVMMSPSVEVQLKKIQGILPGIRQLGVLYGPDETGKMIKNAEAVAEQLGITLLSQPVTNSKKVPTLLMNLPNCVELIWMIPDTTVITPQTIEAFFLFSMENRIPLATFAKMYLDMGAFMAFELDPEDMGRQAGEMANILLSGTSPDQIPAQYARKVTVFVNRKMAKKFGIQLERTISDTVEIVE